MSNDFLKEYYPLGVQCGRKAWDEVVLKEQFEKESRPKPTFFRHLLADYLRQFSETALNAAELELLTTLNLVLRRIAGDFLSSRHCSVMKNQIEISGGVVDLPKMEETLYEFLQFFPAVPVELNVVIPTEIIAPSESNDHVKDILIEMVLLFTQSQNSALKLSPELFADEEQLFQNVTDYRQQLLQIDHVLPQEKDHFPQQPQSLLRRLLEPLQTVTTLHGQLQLLRTVWAEILPADLQDRISSAIEVYEREGQTFDFQGEPETTALDPAAAMYEEYADFTVDLEWMPRTVLLAKSTYVWLEQLSRKYHFHITRLDQIPDEELAELSNYGFTSLWLIGVWERSKASLKIKNQSGQVQVAASAYAIDDYQIASDLGGDSALENLRSRCRHHGLDLACDVVTNHTGIESALLREHPDWFVQLSHPPYPGYQFNGPDLSEDADYSMQIEDGYFDHSEAAVVCRYQNRHNGDVRFIYHGNDGTHLPWNDTAQLNYLLPEVREAMIRLIIDVAQRFRIIRFDAAMTLAKKHFQRLWYPLPGGGDGVPSRNDHAISQEEFNRHFPVEFWRELVDRVQLEAPDTLLVAEAFWLMEGYFVRTLGMHRVYNSAFMNMLKREENEKYRQTLKNILEFDPAILQRFVNFMSNPDEKPAVEQFGAADKYFCVATLLATMPGMPMFGHGQVEGLHEKYGMEYLAPRWQEEPDSALIKGHKQLVFPLLRQRALFSGAERFQLYDFISTHGGVEENIFVYSNGLGEQTSLVICNNSSDAISGKIGMPVAMADRDSLNLTVACGIDCSSDFVLMEDLASGEHSLQPASTLTEGGVFHLAGYARRVVGHFQPLQDNDGRWNQLWQRYGDAQRRNLYFDRDGLLLEPSWESAKALLAVERPGQAKVKVSKQLEILKTLYQAPNLVNLSQNSLLEVLVHTLFPAHLLTTKNCDELGQLIAATSSLDETELFVLLDRFFNHRDLRPLLNCHYHEQTDWFGKEPFELLCLLLLQFKLMTNSRDESLDNAAFHDQVVTLLKTLDKAKKWAEKSGYGVDTMLQLMDPAQPQEKVLPVPFGSGMKILFVASEAAPFAKTGGLADVVGSLPRALRELGHDVRVIIPCHQSVMRRSEAPVKLDKSIEVPLQGTTFRGSLKEAVYDGVPYWFVDTPELFDRPELYGTAYGDYADNALRFGFFSRAVLELIKVADFKPDLIHLHDWQTGLVSPLLKSFYQDDDFYAGIKTVLTIHNLGYQGMFSPQSLRELDLPQELNSPEALEYYGRMSFLKGGINLSDLVTTVSPTYCNEIQEPEQGHGFDGLLRSRRDVLHGIINGLDLRLWNPATDIHLQSRYSAEKLRGKSLCKKALQQELGLEIDSSKALVVVVSRLDPQKGINLIEAMWPQLLERNLQFVLLGSGSEEQMSFWQEQQGKHLGQVSINLTFNEGLSHRLYAAADLLLVPSRYEPCGLTQMIALKYGALPVVRRTGGLADSVTDVDASPKHGYGFVFDHVDAGQLLATIDRGLSLYGQRRRWLQVVKRGMAVDFSWGNSASQYVKLYRQLLEK